MTRTVNARKHPRSLRIIAGEWRGRRLSFPDGTSVRPTPDRVRETLFNWLQPHLYQARCLDLFAGSGILGFEALSRGARETWFVEKDRRLGAALLAHAALLGAKAHVVNGDTVRFLERLSPTPFDIVFVDPPYSLPLQPILARLPPLLRDGSLVYVERSARDGLPVADSIVWRKMGRAGAVCYGLAELAPARA
jgi:16S rRNA (guanine966-N2)-methyltransferase